MKLGLSTKYNLLIIPVVIGTTILSLILTYNWIRNIFIDTQKARLSFIVNSLSQNIEETVVDMRNLAMATATRRDLEKALSAGDIDMLNSILKNLFEFFPLVGDIMVADGKGRVVATVQKAGGDENVSTRPFWREFETNQRPFLIEKRKDESSCIAWAPIRSGDKRMSGCVGIVLDLDLLYFRCIGNQFIGKPEEPLLIDGKGRVLATKRGFAMKLDQKACFPMWKIGNKDRGFFENLCVNNKTPDYVFFSKLNQLDLYCCITLEKSAILKINRTLIFAFSIFGALLSVTIIIFMVILTRKMVVSPLGALCDGITRFIKTDFRDYKPYKRDSQDEISAISERFNRLAAKIQSDKATLEATIHSLSEARNDLISNQDKLEEEVTQRTIELVKAKNEAEIANEAKTTFLASMSHEIRTPLNAITGFAQILAKDPELGEKHRRNAENIKNGSLHLMSLVNNILEVSRIRSNDIPVDLDLFNLCDMIEHVRALFEGHLKARSVPLVVKMPSDANVQIRSDERKLRQVLINLIGNAYKFTKKGRITLEIVIKEKTPSDENGEKRIRHDLVVSVSDTGCGMDKSQLKHLFKPFERIQSVNTQAQGASLGLSICRKFIECLGGEISVNSELDAGSVFTFRIPVEMRFAVSEKANTRTDDWHETVEEKERAETVGRRIPEELLRKLRNAVNAGNISEIKRLLSTVDDENDENSAFLSKIEEFMLSYDFEALSEWLETP